MFEESLPTENVPMFQAEMEGILAGGSQMDDAIFNYDPNSAWSPWDETGQPLVIGDPIGDADTWRHQTTEFTCAVAAQRGILESYGVDVSEARLVYDATVNGWLTDGGTSAPDVGALLEHYDIPCHANSGATLDNLAYELSLGHKVIVSVDSGELQGTDSPLEDIIVGERADHVIQVTGIIRDESGQVWVAVNDSGVPDGQAAMHKWEDFADAWADGGNYYVATNVPPGELLPDGDSLMSSASAACAASTSEPRLGGVFDSVWDFVTGEKTARVFGAAVAALTGNARIAVQAGIAWENLVRSDFARWI